MTLNQNYLYTLNVKLQKFAVRERKNIDGFILVVLPTLVISLILLKYQVSDIGGAKRDARVGHIPLIKYLALNYGLPAQSDYSVANIPLWHYLASWIYSVFGSEISIHIFQILMSVTGLYVFYSVILKLASREIALVATSALAVNGYFLASSYYATTDGFALNLFIVFCWVLNRSLKNPGNISDLLWLNAIISLSALNRQMFLFLFAIYGLAFIGKRSLFRIILEILPAIFVVLAGFFLFYEKYCQFRISEACWPVRQSQDLYFPVLVNFSIVSVLVAIFGLPILYLNKEFTVVSKIKIGTLFLAILIFYAVIGESIIQRGDFIPGGGLYKIRDYLGEGMLLFDSISVFILILIVYISLKRLKENNWALIAIIVVCASSFFGPFAFQRYYEPYLLILIVIYLSSNWKGIFGNSSARFLVWISVLLFFQSIETGLSLFIDA